MRNNTMAYAFAESLIHINPTPNALKLGDLVAHCLKRHITAMVKSKPNRGFSTKLSFKTYHQLKSKGIVE